MNFNMDESQIIICSEEGIHLYNPIYIKFQKMHISVS